MHTVQHELNTEFSILSRKPRNTRITTAARDFVMYFNFTNICVIHLFFNDIMYFTLFWTKHPLFTALPRSWNVTPHFYWNAALLTKKDARWRIVQLKTSNMVGFRGLHIFKYFFFGRLNNSFFPLFQSRIPILSQCWLKTPSHGNYFSLLFLKVNGAEAHA